MQQAKAGQQGGQGAVDSPGAYLLLALDLWCTPETVGFDSLTSVHC